MTSMLFRRQSNANHQNAATDIPSSTVVAIGGGFVCFAFVIISSLTLVRVLKLSREARRRRRRGEQVTLRQLWDRQGGFWGFISGNGSGNDNMLIGAGGRGISRFALMQELRLLELVRENRKKEDLIPPKMWEVEVPEKEKVEMEDGSELRLGQCEPLGVVSSLQPLSAEENDDPTLNLSVLILLPNSRSDKEKRSSLIDQDEDDYADLPEMVVGTTTILPCLRAAGGSQTSSDSLEEEVKNLTAGHAGKEMTNVEVEEVGMETTHGAALGVRRARWAKNSDGRWIIEGLG